MRFRLLLRVTCIALAPLAFTACPSSGVAGGLPGAGGGGGGGLETTGGGDGGGGGGGSDDGGVGGGDAEPQYPPTPQSDAEAARFLAQATFGPTRADIVHLRQVGYARWLDEQMDLNAAPVTSMLAHLQTLEAAGVLRERGDDDTTPYMGPRDRRNAWLWRTVDAPDQLRLRVAFALSEIFVVSDRDVPSASGTLYRIADYQDLLSRGAFGSYRTLLEHVSRHPAMGYYLSFAGNRKADPVKGRVPDENYGREVMQLFSIGLHQRNADGTPTLDANGHTIPTYDQDTVAAMARVFTGWTYAGQTTSTFGRSDVRSYAPMECHPEFHDDQPKRIFDGIIIDEGNDCAASLTKTIDALAAHRSTAPFISRQLIQRLVTSNPSPAYIARVTRVWADTDGNLGQVVKAILLDGEARATPTSATFGKAREPLLKITTLWRAFGARYVPDAQGLIRFGFRSASDLTPALQQDSLRSPSVFNFFEPDFSVQRPDGAGTLLAPEFQILTEASFVSTVNVNDSLVWKRTGAAPTETTPAPIMDVSELVALAGEGDHAGMVDAIDGRLFFGSLSAQSRQALIDMLDALGAAGQTADVRAESLLLLAVSSPDFAIQR